MVVASQATGTYETRQAAFRGAGMTAEEQRRANLQLQQIASKSQSDREDLNTFSEAAPLLVEPIRRAWAARNKHALDGNLEKDFRTSTTVGNLKAEDFTKGIELFVKRTPTLSPDRARASTPTLRGSPTPSSCSNKVWIRIQN